MKAAVTSTAADELRLHLLSLVSTPLIGRGHRGRMIRRGLHDAATRIDLLAAFAERILIYSVEGDEDWLYLKFGAVEVCRVRANSPQAVALLSLEVQRLAALQKQPEA